MKNTVHHDYLPELYPRISVLTKNTTTFDVALLPPSRVKLSFLLQTFVENPGDGGRISPNSQKLTHFPHQKNHP